MKDQNAVNLGRKGGIETAKRGPSYYKEIQSRRVNFKGGRPPKDSKNDRVRM